LEEFDIERFARQMILEHGIHARSEAAKWAAKMLERRDFEAYRFWGQAWAAIKAAQNSSDT
jgi:hypothetical protein